MANGHLIMTETLPTVVGMGVVAKTTDTMFGGRRRRGTKRTARRTTRGTSSRKSKSARTRVFNGKRYTLANTHNTKKVAEKDAEYFRKAGHSARVVKVGGKYAVYVR